MRKRVLEKWRVSSICLAYPAGNITENLLHLHDLSSAILQRSRFPSYGRAWKSGEGDLGVIVAFRSAKGRTFAERKATISPRLPKLANRRAALPRYAAR